MANKTANVSKVNFCLNIPDISKLDVIYSPEYLVQGIPWKVQVCKRINGGKESIAVYLYCMKKEKPENWSHVAFATFKLIPFNEDADSVEVNTQPYVFDYNFSGFGSTLVGWGDLFEAKKCYVKDDTINLDISIEAADRHKNSKSKLTIQNIESGCKIGCVTKFRLSVTNIKHLMAVQSQQLNMQKMPWVFSVYKSRSSMLSVRLMPNCTEQNISLMAKARVKLISSKGDKNSIEITEDEAFENTDQIFDLDVVAWDELCKSENAFVNKDSINMEVKIKMKINQQDHDQNDKAVCSKCMQKMECSICWENMRNQEVSSTRCGHLFCKKCITKSIEGRENCPLCNATVTPNDLFPVFLPFTH